MSRELSGSPRNNLRNGLSSQSLWDNSGRVRLDTVISQISFLCLKSASQRHILLLFFLHASILATLCTVLMVEWSLDKSSLGIIVSLLILMTLFFGQRGSCCFQNYEPSRRRPSPLQLTRCHCWRLGRLPGRGPSLQQLPTSDTLAPEQVKGLLVTAVRRDRRDWVT